MQTYEQNKAVRAERLANRQCLYCGEPVSTYRSCLKCRQRRSKRRYKHTFLTQLREDLLTVATLIPESPLSTRLREAANHPLIFQQYSHQEMTK